MNNQMNTESKMEFNLDQGDKRKCSYALSSSMESKRNDPHIHEDL